MKSTRPLAETGTTAERLLLAAGTDERPDAESVRKAASALGIVPRAALTAATLTIAWRAARTSLTSWRSLSLAGAVGLAGAAGVAGLVIEHGGHGVPPAAVAPVNVSAVAPVNVSAVAPVPASAVPGREAPPLSPSPVELAPVPGPPRAASRRPAAAGTADRLREEAEALDGARARLASGEPNAALARLGDYDRRFASGSLHEEALVLRIEALVRLQDRSAAHALATRFLATYPTSVHAGRVAQLLRDSPEEQTP
jgi:hypothetical protein